MHGRDTIALAKMDCARTMTPSFVVSVVFFCLLLLQLPAQHGASYHKSYMQLGSRQIFFKSPAANSQQASTVPPATTCSSITTGLGNNKLPIVHRHSPCSPLHGLPSLTAADVLRRDTSRLIRRRRRFSSQSSMVAAPAPSPSAFINIPANGSSDRSTLPGQLDYSVLVGYGSPQQQFPVFLDTSIGASVMRCKPCASGSDDCDPAFDTSRSSTFAHVPCGSPDCPATNCAGGSVCPFNDTTNDAEGKFAQDVLTLAPSTAVHDFRFVCVDAGHPYGLPEAGSLDLSRDPNSLPSRLSSSPAFSYCLPQSPSSQGFLSLGGNGTVFRDDNRAAAHAPLVSNEGNPALARMYFIDLVGMSLGGEDLPIPADAFGNNGINLDVWNPFTVLPPAAYTALSDAFRKQMSQYINRTSLGTAFDTCYNFTGLDELVVPLVEFKFGNGEILLIDGDQMLYYDDPAAAPFTLACLAFSALDVDDDSDAYAFSAIGTYTLASTEVVYDVAGGKVGFIPRSC